MGLPKPCDDCDEMAMAAASLQIYHLKSPLPHCSTNHISLLINFTSWKMNTMELETGTNLHLRLGEMQLLVSERTALNSIH